MILYFYVHEMIKVLQELVFDFTCRFLKFDIKMFLRVFLKTKGRRCGRAGRIIP